MTAREAIVAVLASITNRDVGKLTGAFLQEVRGQVIAVSRALLSVGYNTEQLANALCNGLDASGEIAAELLRALGWKASDVARALRQHYDAVGLGIDLVATWMRDAGFNAVGVLGALKAVYGASTETLARALEAAGFTANAVGDALRQVVGGAASQLSAVMIQAGYGAEDVLRWLQNAFGLSAEAMVRMLLDAGASIAELIEAVQAVMAVTNTPATEIVASVLFG